jgi:hypothetical protein
MKHKSLAMSKYFGALLIGGISVVSCADQRAAREVVGETPGSAAVPDIAPSKVAEPAQTSSEMSGPILTVKEARPVILAELEQLAVPGSLDLTTWIASGGIANSPSELRANGSPILTDDSLTGTDAAGAVLFTRGKVFCSLLWLASSPGSPQVESAALEGLAAFSKSMVEVKDGSSDTFRGMAESLTLKSGHRSLAETRDIQCGPAEPSIQSSLAEQVSEDDSTNEGR